MSDDPSRDERRTHLTALGLFKFATRLVRHGQSLSPNAFKVLFFIFDRTASYDFAFKRISDAQFLQGAFVGGDRETFSVGLNEAQLAVAIQELVDRRVIARTETPIGVYYEIFQDWTAEGLRPMWEIDENEDRYR